jgi:hypothetical protein
MTQENSKERNKGSKFKKNNKGSELQVQSLITLSFAFFEPLSLYIDEPKKPLFFATLSLKKKPLSL